MILNKTDRDELMKMKWISPFDKLGLLLTLAKFKKGSEICIGGRFNHDLGLSKANEIKVK